MLIPEEESILVSIKKYWNKKMNCEISDIAQKRVSGTTKNIQHDTIYMVSQKNASIFGDSSHLL